MMKNAWNARNAGMPECWNARMLECCGTMMLLKKYVKLLSMLFTQQHFVPNPITKKLIVNTFLCIVLVDQYFLSW